MAKAKIKIEKNEDNFIIIRDKNYEFLLSISVVFYQRIIKMMQESQGINLVMNKKFESLLGKIIISDDQIILNEEELKLYSDWLDCLCLIMLDLESIDFKSKDIKKYLSLSENFIKQSKNFLIN